ncbi:Homeobox-like_domain superfamily [Hexamita inflata]|uniref:Homeobox-like domain superfamily n=1 Tax=Hexamita inflata TaxID=28002 RepID=A0AA86P175_9EUKA|nr:Homeobox-like domain superfamily [Hexamita inflata]
MSNHGRKFSEHARNCIVVYIQKNGDTRDIKIDAAGIFKCSRSSIQNIWNTFKKEGRTKPKYSDGVQKTFNNGEQLIIKNIALGDPFLCAREVAESYFQSTGKSISIRSVTRILNQFDLTSRLSQIDKNLCVLWESIQW